MELALLKQLALERTPEGVMTVSRKQRKVFLSVTLQDGVGAWQGLSLGLVAELHQQFIGSRSVSLNS